MCEGWMIVVAAKPLLAALDAWTLGWLLAGGLSYTLGTVFYHARKCAIRMRFWHLFVIVAASATTSRYWPRSCPRPEPRPTHSPGIDWWLRTVGRWSHPPHPCAPGPADTLG